MQAKIVQFILGVAAAAILAGCGKSSSPAPEAAAPAAPGQTPAASTTGARTYTIGMSQCNLGEPWRVQMDEDIRKAAEAHPELKVVFKDAQNDTLKQRSQIEEFVSAKVDALIVSPREAQPLTDPVAAAMDAGIPVIVLDRAVLGDKYTCFIGADNKKIGKAAGEWIVKKLGGKGNVVELEGLMTTIPGQDRHEGFREGIAGSGIDVIFTSEMKWLEPNARSEMESALARFDKIDLVYAHNDPGAHGAYLAAKEAGRTGILFVGIDALPQEGVAYVQQGILDATFRYPTGGAEAIDAALKVLHGQTVPKKIVLGTMLFDKEHPQGMDLAGGAIGSSDLAKSDDSAPRSARLSQ
jgi:ribose transport system substrate-binding protein